MENSSNHIDNIISPNIPLNLSQDVVLDVSQSENLLDAIRFILDKNTIGRVNETLTVFQEEIFEIIEQLREYPQKMFMYLRKHFAKHFDIDLYIVAFENEKFSLITKDDYGKENKAFLAFNKDNTVHGPLYVVNAQGTEKTVFPVHDPDIQVDAYIYVTRLNDSKVRCDFYPAQEQQAVSCEQETIENTTSTTQLSQPNLGHIDDRTQCDALFDKMCSQISWLLSNLTTDSSLINQSFEPTLSDFASFEHLSLQDTITAVKDRIQCLMHLIQMSEPQMSNDQHHLITLPDRTDDQTTDIRYETDMVSDDDNDDVSFEALIADNVPTTEQSSNVLTHYNPPVMRYLLRSPIHPRTMKEFATTGSSPVQCVNSKQREPLHIQVPSEDSNLLYLGMKVVTVDNQNHSSKIIVPDKTQVVDEVLLNNNDLRCLNYDGCHPNDSLYVEKREIYSKISSTERRASQKDIRIHMLNLYQRGRINRKMVHDNHLKKCKLALWFSVRQNNSFTRMSPIFYSNVAEEYTQVPKKTNGVKKASKIAYDAH